MLGPFSNYRQTELNWLKRLPDSWDILRTKQVFRLRIEKAPENNQMELLSIYTHIGVKPRKELEQRGNKASTTDGYWIVKKGDIISNKLLAWMGAVGVSHYEGVTSPAYDILRPIRQCNTDYYHYLFRTPKYLQQFKIRSRGIMDMRLRLYFDQLGQIPVPVPPTDEQDSIVLFLNWKTAQINKFIRNKRRFIELLKEQKQNVINQAVTRGLDLNVKLKPSGVEWIGDIPEHWEARRLRTLAAVRASGVDKNTNEDEVPVLLCNYVDVYKNDRITAAIDFMKATATPEEIRAFELKAGDVIITKDSESWDDIAIPTFVPEALPGVVCAYHLALIRPFSGEIEGEFLFRAFSSDPVADQFRIAATGVTRFGLAQGAIKGAFFPLPPLEEQRAIIAHINEKCAEISQAISRAQREIELMREYRTRLISDVVTGQVDVRGIEVPDVAEEELLSLEEDTGESDDVMDDEGEMDETD
ncbi:MAG: EcoKI restriction-modification system protein HsdS [Syntrophus sp. PtaU1.Bin005]|jgi:type I restriction enzyme S subunit|nr:MAG: EcoKI restriction-modification system protein HsdS [Syntrophus sp. PtaU1.Bin005]